MIHKLKRNDRSDWYTFLCLWIAIGGGIGLINILLASVIPHSMPIELLQSPVGAIGLGVFMAFLSGALLGLGQQALLMYHWQIPVFQWWWVTAAGYALAEFVSVMLMGSIIDNSPSALASLGASLFVYIMVMGLAGVVPAVLQATILNQYFREVWMYVLMFLVGGIVSVALSPIFTVAVSKMIFGVFTGGSLVWMANQTQSESEKQPA